LLNTLLRVSLFRLSCFLTLTLWATALSAPIFDVNLPVAWISPCRIRPLRKKYLIETMPGGVALLDYNNDGLLDIFLVNGRPDNQPHANPENFDRHDPRY